MLRINQLGFLARLTLKDLHFKKTLLVLAWRTKLKGAVMDTRRAVSQLLVVRESSPHRKGGRGQMTGKGERGKAGCD